MAHRVFVFEDVQRSNLFGELSLAKFALYRVFIPPGVSRFNVEIIRQMAQVLMRDDLWLLLILVASDLELAFEAG